MNASPVATSSLQIPIRTGRDGPARVGEQKPCHTICGDFSCLQSEQGRMVVFTSTNKQVFSEQQGVVSLDNEMT